MENLFRSTIATIRHNRRLKVTTQFKKDEEFNMDVSYGSLHNFLVLGCRYIVVRKSLNFIFLFEITSSLTYKIPTIVFWKLLFMAQSKSVDWILLFLSTI